MNQDKPKPYDGMLWDYVTRTAAAIEQHQDDKGHYCQPMAPFVILIPTGLSSSAKKTATENCIKI